MRKFLFLLLLCIAVNGYSQYDADTENGVVSLARNNSFSLQTKDEKFLFKPYMLVQTSLTYSWYDDEGLDKAYNQDNIMNSGFAIPYAVLGFTGKAFGRVTYNLSINAAGSGGAILQQAWFDVASVGGKVAMRAGKFKTPFTNAYLTTLGETLFPCLPISLTSQVILPYSLNAVTPNIGTGFDLGVEVHGLANWFGYQIGIFNGTGASVNTAGKTLSDDWHIPSLLYACRFSFTPFGVMPQVQGNQSNLEDNKLLIAVSSSINVESEYESTNDFRCGAEVAWNYHRLYLSSEFYYMHIGFTKRQKIDETYSYLGFYAQCGYFVTEKFEPAIRYDFYNRNGLDRNGFLNMPAIGINYYFLKTNLKLQAMYQYIGRTGHDTQLDRDNDNLGLATHSGVVLLQYTF